MRLSKILLASFVTLAIGLGASGTASAQAPNNPVGLWSVTFYNDNTPGLTQMATQNICFVVNGTWYGTTFPSWGGRWFQKGNNAAGNGNRVRLDGNYASGVGNDSAEIDFVHLKLMTGAWNEWRDGFPFFVWTRVLLTKLGTTCPAPLGPETETATVIDDGSNPLDKDGAPAPTCAPF
jgi:hypothetical protein